MDENTRDVDDPQRVFHVKSFPLFSTNVASIFQMYFLLQLKIFHIQPLHRSKNFQQVFDVPRLCLPRLHKLPLGTRGRYIIVFSLGFPSISCRFRSERKGKRSESSNPSLTKIGPLLAFATSPSSAPSAGSHEAFRQSRQPGESSFPKSTPKRETRENKRGERGTSPRGAFHVARTGSRQHNGWAACPAQTLQQTTSKE